MGSALLPDLKILSTHSWKPGSFTKLPEMNEIEDVEKLTYIDFKITDYLHYPTIKAKMIAWRVCKLWLEAQLTHVNLGQAKMEEVFLPYMVVNGNLTVYETMVERGMLLPEGKTS